MSSPYSIIRRLVRSEKGMALSGSQNQYFFEVDRNANKVEVKKAVESIYKVKVTDIQTLIMPRKPKMLRRSPGFSPEWKKAIVRLASGQTIDLKV